MKRIATLSIILLTTLGLPLSPGMMNNARAESLVLKPVMIIRFNEPDVDFAKQLATVIQSASQKKSDVAFDVIQYVPVQSVGGLFDDNLQSVIAAIKANGITEDRVQANVQASPDVSSDEIYIYVR